MQLQLHNTNYNTPHYIQQLWVRWLTTWPLQWLNHSKKHNSNYLSVHQWIRSAIRDSQQPTLFLFFKLPPPPCVVLLVYGHVWKWSDCTCICIYIFWTPGNFGHSEKFGFNRWFFPFEFPTNSLKFEIVSFSYIYPLASPFISQEVIFNPNLIFMENQHISLIFFWHPRFPGGSRISTHDFTKAQGLQPKGAMPAEDGGDLGAGYFHGDYEGYMVIIWLLDCYYTVVVKDSTNDSPSNHPKYDWQTINKLGGTCFSDPHGNSGGSNYMIQIYPKTSNWLLTLIMKHERKRSKRKALPSGNQAWQLKIHNFWMIFSLILHL